MICLIHNVGTKGARNKRKLFIPVCRYKYYLHPRQRTLPDPRRGARKVFHEVRAPKQDQTCSEFRRAEFS